MKPFVLKLVAAVLMIGFTGACSSMRNEDLATRIATLEDRAAIKQLVDRFSVLADLKKTQEQTLLFTEEATVSTTVNGQVVSSLRGPPATRRGVWTLPRQLRHRLPRQRPTRSHAERRYRFRRLLLPGHAHRHRERQAHEDVDARDLQRLVRATRRDVADRGSQVELRHAGTGRSAVSSAVDSDAQGCREPGVQRVSAPNACTTPESDPT
jgi:SnoaL-like domain